MLIVLRLLYNAILLSVKSLKKETCLSRFELCFGTKVGYVFSFLAFKTLKTIAKLFLSNFSNHHFLMGNLFLPNYIYL